MTERERDEMHLRWCSRYEAGWPFHRIARADGVTAATVRMQVLRIIEAMRKAGEMPLTRGYRPQPDAQPAPTGRRDWSDADQATLERMLAEGATYSQAAEYFGVTRNAIAGKAHRLRQRHA